jgi:hypothetical protein
VGDNAVLMLVVNVALALTIAICNGTRVAPVLALIVSVSFRQQCVTEQVLTDFGVIFTERSTFM